MDTNNLESTINPPENETTTTQPELEITKPIIDLTLDYMISLKIYLETEYNIEPDSHSSIIRHLFNFLKSIDISTDNIKSAINLLYENEHPEKIDEMHYILNRLLTIQPITSSLSDLFTSYSIQLINHQENQDNQENQEDNQEDNTFPLNQQYTSMIDRYTYEFINPSNILNIFTTNLNNITPNNLANFQLIYTTPGFRTIIPQTTIFDHITISDDPTLLHQNNDSRIRTHENGKETLTKSSLNNSTIIEEFSDLDEENKKKYDTCPICFDDFKDENIIRKLQCHHIFHKKCIDPWLLYESYTCPVCRDSTLPKPPPQI
jgi:hypothetical protein